MVEATYTIAISGMTCASCVGRVENALQNAQGIVSAEVNFATGQARVLTHGLSADQVVSLIGAAGYAGAVADARQTPDHDAEADTLFRRTMLAIILTLPVFVLEMGGHLVPAFHHFIMATIGIQTSWMLQFVLTFFVLIGPGRTFFTLGIKALLRLAPDMNSLVAIGAGAAFVFSSLVVFAPDVIPSASRAVYFEAAALIVTLILLGRWFEARAKGRTGSAIKALIGLQPKTAQVIRNGLELELPIADIVLGDVIHLRAGERIAVDGIVKSGHSHVDEAMLTGEPIPAEKQAGAKVTAGTVNGNGALVITAGAVGADTVLAQIIQMVADAQGAKLPVQGQVDRITLWFVPAVLAIAMLTVFAWLAFGPGLGQALVAGVSVLIIACPCAMGLAVPTSVMVGTGRAAEQGILVRKGAALQRLAEVTIVAFDKTGTLTVGRPEVQSVHIAKGWERSQVLRLAAAVETGADHPIANSIRRLARGEGGVKLHANDLQNHPGLGLAGQVHAHQVLVGNQQWMLQNNIQVQGFAPQLVAAQDRGETLVLIAVDGALAGIITLSDPLKPSAGPVVQALQKSGCTIAVISGDTKQSAGAVARALGIDELAAEVRPDGKADVVEELRQRGLVAFVGDGINDAPALASADLGIAIGTGTDVAIEAADVVLMSGDLDGVIRARRISMATLRNIRQNLVWAFSYNVLLIPVAAGVFYPLFGWQLSPALAAGAMALSSVFVVTNALRLTRA
jgi:Cu+-exporting ATPase